jgi:hypothetical protein
LSPILHPKTYGKHFHIYHSPDPEELSSLVTSLLCLCR